MSVPQNTVEYLPVAGIEYLPGHREADVSQETKPPLLHMNLNNDSHQRYLDSVFEKTGRTYADYLEMSNRFLELHGKWVSPEEFMEGDFLAASLEISDEARKEIFGDV